MGKQNLKGLPISVTWPPARKAVSVSLRRGLSNTLSRHSTVSPPFVFNVSGPSGTCNHLQHGHMFCPHSPLPSSLWVSLQHQVSNISILDLKFFPPQAPKELQAFPHFPFPLPAHVTGRDRHASADPEWRNVPAHLRLEGGGTGRVGGGEPKGSWFLLLWPFAFPLGRVLNLGLFIMTTLDLSQTSILKLVSLLGGSIIIACKSINKWKFLHTQQSRLPRKNLGNTRPT